ncbi:MAG: thiamine pyrophosphate-binding protein [Candidatus Omnitrophica bacterium]|nr:thiamine pyrophosphate-binding protein [Candidatus Omnitrophota bacterium]
MKTHSDSSVDEMRHSNAASVVVECLHKEGVKHVFGLLGSHILGIFAELAGHESIRLVVSKHENNASFMADMAGRLTGRPGVAIATAGPGATNSITAVAQAYASNSPLVHISGAVRQGAHPFEFHGTQSAEAGVRSFAEFTKWSTSVHSLEALGPALAKAFHLAVTGRPGPVHVEIPHDIMLAKPILLPPYQPIAPVEGRLDARAVRRLLRLFSQAKRPLILGGGVAKSLNLGEGLAALAERSQALVALSDDNAWGAIPDHRPNFIGYSGGINTNRYARQALCQADFILAVGHRSQDEARRYLKSNGFYGRSFYLGCPQNDLDPKMAGLPKTLSALTEALSGKTSPVQPQWVSLAGRLQQDRDAWRETLISPQVPGPSPDLGRVLSSLSKRLDSDAVVIGGIGNNNYWLRAMLPVKQANAHFGAGSWGSMGWELGGAIAAKLLCPQRQVLAVTGDGSMLMSLSDLGTALEENLKILLIVFNDSGYGMMESMLGKTSKFWTGTRYLAPDFASLAESFGVKGIQLKPGENPEPKLDQAFEALEHGPVVLEVLGALNHPVPDFSEVGKTIAHGSTPGYWIQKIQRVKSDFSNRMKRALGLHRRKVHP